MISRRSIYLLVLSLAMTSAFSISYTQPSRGRKLFGGYRIVPKVCQPTNPPRVKSNKPAICMFNHECTRGNGEVVGACMDGFLFGACCQLPAKQGGVDNLEKVQGSDDLLNVYEIDHVPEIPILLNPDGTPVGTSSTAGLWNPTKSGSSSNSVGGTFTKVSTVGPFNNYPSSSNFHNTKDSNENAEKPQVNYGTLENNFPNLLGQQQVLDDLRLPELLTHSDSNNDIQDHQDSSVVNPVATLLNADQVLQIADPVDQLPVLFSQGIASSNHSGPETILLNENGSTLNETHNPDEIFKPTNGGLSSTKFKLAQGQTTLSGFGSTSFPYKSSSNILSSTVTKKITTKVPVFTQKYAYSERLSTTTQGLKSTNAFDQSKKPGGEKNNEGSTAGVLDVKATASKVMSTFETTTPMTSSGSGNNKNSLVRVPTITYDAGNKKNDEFDREEVAINHIISILNNTTPSSETKFTSHGGNTASSIQTWVSIDETSKPSLLRISSTRPSSISTESFPYTYLKPGQSSNYYYEVSTESPGTTSFSSSSSGGSPTFLPSRIPVYTSGAFQGSSSLSTRPTTNPPAPTVIVLSPLNTEYTTIETQKPSTRRPITITKPTIIKTNTGTKKPLVSTTITHNISTVISGSTINNKHVVSTSYISVNLKDGTTSVKPSTIKDPGLSTETIVSDGSSTYDVLSSSTKKPATAWTTISSWTNNKPSFHMKPESNINWSQETYSEDSNKDSSKVPVVSTTTPYDDETAAPDDSIIFPPVRHPELNISNAVVQQEKPTIVIKGNETDYPENFIVGDIPTPSFIEDDVLKNKVDSFVNKIVDSLQGNFEDLKDVVYTKKNNTAPPPPPPTKSPLTTKKPSSTKRPKPTQVTTKKPVVVKKTTTLRPSTSGKPSTLRPKPISGQSVTTKRTPVTTKRTKPVKITTPPNISEPVVSLDDQESSSQTPDSIPTSDFRKACGQRPLVKTGRIVGGKGATFGEWPWQVLVRETTWLGLFTKNKCGGVLITDKYVITAAHCQPGFLASLVAVFGEHDISGELEPKRSMSRNVRRVVVNRGYDPATFENDLALLELESPITFDSHVVPICMPDDNADFTGRMATVTGWGRLKYNGGVPSVLQEVHVPIMENSVCQEMFQTAGHSKLILDSFLCAGYANGQKDSCEGDSGGPLTMQRSDGRWTLVGTVSHGIKCAAPYLPGVYMRTTYFKPWLHTISGV